MRKTTSDIMSVDTPKVSILLTSYNQALYIEEAYLSVLNQTYANIEIIGIDNGSTDGTRQIILEKFASHPKVRFSFNEKNESIQVVSKKTLELSTGKYISILYGDDYYLSEKIQLQVEQFAQLGLEYGVVYGPGWRFNQLTGEKWFEHCIREEGEVFSRMLMKYHTDGPIPPIVPLIRRECYASFPLKDELITEGEDILLRFALGYKFSYLNTPLVVMRDHTTNMGKAFRTNHLHFIRAMELMRREPRITPEGLRALHTYAGRTLRNYGWQGIRLANDTQWAFGRFSQSIRWDFKQIFHPRTLVGLALCGFPARLLKALNSFLTFFFRKTELGTSQSLKGNRLSEASIA